MKRKKQVPDFIIALKSEDSGVRIDAAIVLGMIGDARAVDALVSALRDENSDVQKFALEALEKISSDWFRSDEAKRQVPDFIVALKSENIRVRVDAAKVLGKISDIRAMGALISALRDEDGDVRKSALEALEKISSDWFRSDEAKRQVPDFIVALKSENIRVRVDAAKVLGKISDIRAMGALISALRDEDGDVRKSALEALEKISSDWFRSDEAKRQVPDFIVALRSGNSSVRVDAAKVL
ncbi:MAG: HEAT repeat domain-containing protein, partial [Candidatus Kryptonium sp.]